MIANQHDMIILALLVANQHKKWLLPDPITVRLSNADYDIIEIHGLWVSQTKELLIMSYVDDHGHQIEDWDKLGLSDERSQKIITAIHDRLLMIYKKSKSI